MVASAAGVIVFGVLLVAGTRKILHPQEWRRMLRQYGLPRPVRLVSFAGVPWIEVGLAVVGLGVAARGAAALSVPLLVLFVGAVLRLRWLTSIDRVPCGCFGDGASRDYRQLLARNGVLAALAVAVWVAHPDGGIVDVADGELVVIGLLGAGLAWSTWQLREAVRRRQERAVLVP